MNQRAGAAAIFLRIVEQVEQNLLQQIGVAADQRQVARKAGRDLQIGNTLRARSTLARTTSETST